MNYRTAIAIVICVALPFLMGHFLPKSGLLDGRLEFVNLPWSSVFGLGWAASEDVFHAPSSVSGLVGFVIWPIIVLLALILFVRKATHFKPITRAIIGTLFIASFFMNVSVDSVEHGFASKLPLFWKYYSAAA